MIKMRGEIIMSIGVMCKDFKKEEIIIKGIERGEAGSLKKRKWLMKLFKVVAFKYLKKEK